MSYDHTQNGWFHWLLVALCVLFVFMADVPLEEEPPPEWVPWLLRGMGALFLLLAACFAHLRVRDDGDALLVQFGPVGLFRRRVPYADITAAAAGRSKLIDGWGIHHLPGRGWTWNLHGFDCVELELTRERRLRVGTDDPQGLETFLRMRITG